MRRRNRAEGVNPFVVLSDATIALSFIMLVYALFAGIAATKIVIEANRRERQRTIRESIVAAWRKTRASLTETASGSEQTTRLYSQSGQVFARIDENASFQRIQVYAPQYSDGQAVNPLTTGHNLLDDALEAAARNWAELSYIQIHGLASTPGRDGVALSQARANAMVERWQRLGLIESYDAHYRSSSRALPQGVVPIQNVNAYGTGDLIYSSPLPDRVDVVLFFNDRGK